MNLFSRNELQHALFSEIPDIKGKKIIIYGMGNTSQLFQEGLARLDIDGFTINAYCDSNPDKLEMKQFCGKPVIAPKELEGKKDICVLICTPIQKYIHEIAANLDQIGVPHYLLNEVILKHHATEVLKCYDLLADAESKQVYADIILAHIRGTYPHKQNCSPECAYFALPPFQASSSSEVFIDCGSWVGDTIERYIWNKNAIFNKIIAFEPDPDNFTAMQKRTERLIAEWNIKPDKIQLFPYGIADQTMNLAFESHAADNGMGGKFTQQLNNEGSISKIVSLDEFVKEPYTFLKADIESYEYKMLLGAKKGIQKNRPLLAVCIYHNAIDLYSIPLLIHSFVEDYHMAIRHHSNSLLETVLYCWCD